MPAGRPRIHPDRRAADAASNARRLRLSDAALDRLDALALAWDMPRRDVLERLIADAALGLGLRLS